MEDCWLETRCDMKDGRLMIIIINTWFLVTILWTTLSYPNEERDEMVNNYDGKWKVIISFIKNYYLLFEYLSHEMESRRWWLSWWLIGGGGRWWWAIRGEEINIYFKIYIISLPTQPSNLEREKLVFLFL